MKRIIYLAFLLIAVSAAFPEDHEYCSLERCPNQTHTLCKYPNCGAVSRCGTYLRTGLTYEEKFLIISIYNRNRPAVTLYEVGENSEPKSDPVTVEYRVKWDTELERMAQRWANQCINTVDECRNVERFDVRQRVLLEKSKAFDEPLLNPIISRWFREDRSPSLSSFEYKGVSIEETAITAANYLMRLVRHNENRIGCGAVRSYDEEYENLHLVCNYGAAI